VTVGASSAAPRCRPRPAGSETGRSRSPAA
jgi:hypothetical protein